VHFEYACPACGEIINRSRTPVSDALFHPLQKFECPRCQRLHPWWRLTRKTSQVALQGTSFPSRAPTLQQTIFATGGREVLIHDDTGPPAVIENLDVNTAAGTHDGSDATLDSAHWVDGPFPLDPIGSGHIEIIYTMDAVTFAGTISFVRWHFRAKFEHIVGGGRTKQISGMWVESGFGATNTVATQSMEGISSYTSINLDVSTNPATSTPWTAAALNARKFGMQLDFFGTTTSDQSEALMSCSEFWVEIWGIS
jgi:hypothetical protein